jgi:hypothetical protein
MEIALALRCVHVELKSMFWHWLHATRRGADRNDRRLELHSLTMFDEDRALKQKIVRTVYSV